MSQCEHRHQDKEIISLFILCGYVDAVLLALCQDIHITDITT